jgi:high-affinity iron transporter
LGWQNSATYGSVISYNIYWIVVIIGFLLMRYKESKGHLPFFKAKKEVAEPKEDDLSASQSGASSGIFEEGSVVNHLADIDEKAVPTVQAIPTARTIAD